MEPDRSLKLELLNVYGEFISEPVNLRFSNQTLSDVRVVSAVRANRRIKVDQLFGPPNGIYKLDIESASYLPVSRFISVPGTDSAEAVTIVLPVNSRKVVDVSFPAYEGLVTDARNLLQRSGSVLGLVGQTGATLYSSLDNLRRAGMLNIFCKCGRTLLPNGRKVIEYLQELRELRGDRFFVQVSQELREEVRHSEAAGIFQEVPGALHHPPAGFAPAKSFKTLDTYGNLQLTFFANADQWVADVDIDDAQGLGHIFQVLRNAISGLPTNPYDIHEILVAHQELDPGYRLVVGNSQRARAARR